MDNHRYIIQLSEFEKLVYMAEESSEKLGKIKNKLARLKVKRFICIAIGYFLIISIFLTFYFRLIDLGSTATPILTIMSVLVVAGSVFSYYFFVNKETNLLLEDLELELDSLRELLDIIHDIENRHIPNLLENEISLIMLKIRIRRLRFSV